MRRTHRAICGVLFCHALVWTSLGCFNEPAQPPDATEPVAASTGANAETAGAANTLQTATTHRAANTTPAADAVLTAGTVGSAGSANPPDATPAAPAGAAGSAGTASPAGSAGSAPDAADPNELRVPGFLEDAGGGWKNLLTAAWESEPGDEFYLCVRFTVPEATMVGAFSGKNPTGTHHTMLSVSDSADMPDGTTRCTSFDAGVRNIAATSYGDPDYYFPEGVAIDLKPGEQLLLNMHLFNPTSSTLKGVSGTLAKTMEADDVKHLAEGVLAGPIYLDIPATGQPVTQSGNCTIDYDSTVFSVTPHMHQLGHHMKAVAHSSIAGEAVLFDGDYDFDDQRMYNLPNHVPMKAGDSISVECTYVNDRTESVTWGEGSASEMCFAGLYRYPVTGGNYVCAF